MRPDSNTVTRWYQEPWVWGILSVLLVTFVWGSYRVLLAFQVRDSLVVDDYYQNGKSINIDLTRDANAEKLRIQATLLLDDLTGEVRITAEGELDAWPDQLKLSLLSPTFADRDKTMLLNRSISTDDQQVVYVGQLDETTAGKTYVQLETLDKNIPEVGFESGWRLNRTLFLQPGTPAELHTHGQ